MTNKIIIAITAVIFTFSTYAQTATQIISKHIEAIGGAKNWSNLNSLRQTGKIKMQGAEITITTSQIDQKAYRTDIAVMGMNGYTFFTTTEGWMFMPFQGQTVPEPMTPEDVKMSQDQLDIQNDFISYIESGKKLEDLGLDEVDGTECFKLKLTDKDGTETTYFIQTDSYLLLKETTKMTSNGQEMENSVTYSNYVETPEGLFFAMNMATQQGDMEITKIEVNPTIDEEIFKIKK